MHRSHVEYALTLLTRAAGGSDERARMAAQTLQQWRLADPAHEAAYQVAQQRWQALDAMRDDLRAVLPMPPRAARQSRWRWAWPMAALASVALACASWYVMVPLSDQVFATPLAQSGRYALPDGSTVELNAGSEVRVRYYRQRRDVVLLAGEARFEVTSAAERPFSVSGGGLKATVLGTVFVVGQRGAGALVQVEQGVVRVDAQRSWWHPDVTGPTLQAGQQVRGDGQSLGTVQPVPAQQAAAWRHGLAVFDDTSLVEVLQQVQSWSTRPLRLRDAQAGQARITGTFHLNDIDGMLDLLPHIAPVAVRRQASEVEIGSIESTMTPIRKQK